MRRIENGAGEVGAGSQDYSLSDQEIVEIAFKLRSIGADLPSVAIVVMAQQCVGARHAASMSHNNNSTDDTVDSGRQVDFESLQASISEHQTLFKQLDRLNLKDIHEMKPLVNGGKVLEVLECGGGRHVSQILDRLIGYQILNQNAT